MKVSYADVHLSFRNVASHVLYFVFGLMLRTGHPLYGRYLHHVSNAVRAVEKVSDCRELFPRIGSIATMIALTCWSSLLASEVPNVCERFDPRWVLGVRVVAALVRASSPPPPTGDVSLARTGLVAASNVVET